MFPINGFALDVLPWFDQAGIAFRIQSDPPGFDLAEWEHYDLFFDLTMGVAGPLAASSGYAAAAYNNPPSGIEPGEVAHLILLAGAEALLDQTVVDKFYEALGIADNACMFDSWFEYFVLHPDNVCRANYCDIVRANRITESPHKNRCGPPGFGGWISGR